MYIKAVSKIADAGMRLRVKNKFFTRQVCAASSTNIGTLAARKGGSQHEYNYGEIQ